MNRIAVVSVISLIVAFVCGAVPASANTPVGVDLAQLNGWDIVVADDAIASEIYAAEEFQEFFRQASGLKLPIVHKIIRWDKHVFIGPGKVTQASPVGFSVDDLGQEDLRIIVRNNNMVIAGGRPRGTLYGLYTFLEDYLGVRFLTYDHTYVPVIGEQRVIGPLDRVYRPPFVNLRFTSYKAPRQYPVFAARTRNNVNHDEPRFGGDSPFQNINHSLYRQIPLEEYAKEHPEYYALWDDKRRNDHFNTHYCLTNPDLVPIVTKAVLEEIERPGSVWRRNVSVSQNDTQWLYCQCKKCAAIDDRAGSHMGALLAFVNKVADEVAKTHPEHFIGTVAYGFSRTPPKRIKPRPNVQINLNSMVACQLHPLNDPNCSWNVQYMQELKEWSEICKHLYAWTNNIDFYDLLAPFPNLWTIKPKVNVLLNAGVEGVFMQCHTGPWSETEMSDLRYYLISRLLWNPKLNDKELIGEFLNLHYGKAAPPIRRFIDLAQNRYYREHSFHYAPAWSQLSYLPVDESLARAGLQAFIEAMSLSGNEAVKGRVEKASICAYRAAIEPIWKLKKDAAIDPALAERMRLLVKEFFRLCDKYGLGGLVAGDRQRIEGILANQGLAKPRPKLPLLPISKEWRFTTDPKKQGERKNYFKIDFDDSDWTVLKKYDFWPGEYTGVGWYRQTINPPADIADKKHLYLFFGSVDEEAFVYINGEYAFERSVKSTGQRPEVIWNQPFLHDVKGLIRPGQPNVVAVKVHNTVLQGGIRQPVYLFPTDEEWTAQAISDSL